MGRLNFETGLEMNFIVSLQQEGTVKAWEYFNAEVDCEGLRAAMKGMGKVVLTNKVTTKYFFISQTCSADF